MPRRSSPIIRGAPTTGPAGRAGSPAGTIGDADLLSIFRNLATGLLVTDTEGVILLVNQVGAELLGVSVDAAGSRLSDLGGQAQRLNQISDPPRQHTVEVELRGGVRRVLGFTSVEVQLERGPAVVTLFRDIEALRDANERRRRAEQLAQVGEMSAKLSHEIKNPLGSMLLGLQLLERETFLASRQNSILQDVIAEAQRLQRLVQDLIARARPAPLRPALQDLPLLVEGVVSSYVSYAASQGVRLEIRAGARLASRVTADAGGLVQVLSNLVLNAIEASPRGGVVAVSSELLAPAEQARMLPGFSGPVAMLLVRDSGPGISPLLRSKLFKPFFTTKKNGTGLGLAISHELIAMQGGVLDLAPSRSGGCCFMILLPAGELEPCFGQAGQHCGRSCASCAVKREGTGYCCWATTGEAEWTVSSQWLDRCHDCPVFRASNLAFAYRPDLNRPSSSSELASVT
jgi:signal transduction histidine kinase